MERVSWEDFPKRPKAKPSPARPQQSRQQAFIPLAEHFDPLPGWQVCYGSLHRIANRLLPHIDNTLDRKRFLQRRYIDLPWTRVCLRPIKTMAEGQAVSGGELWYTGGRIFDVRPLFMQSFEKTVALYETTDLPTIMEQTRQELAKVGIRAFENRWYKNSAITDNILHQPAFRDLNIPSICIPHEPPAISEQYIGSVAAGFIPGPIYEYDLVSAFASGLLEVPELRPFIEQLHEYRTALQGKPAARIIKITQSVLPGKLISDKVDPRWQNRSLGLYTRAVTRYKLAKAMMQAVEKGGTVFRWYIDGFYTNVRIEPDDGLEGQLGGWKETIHQGGMLIIDTSVFQLYDAAGNVTKERTNGHFNVDWNGARDDPLHVRADKTTVNWNTLKETTKHVKLLFELGFHKCTYCPGGSYHLTREGWDQYFH
jgi:hypothetical protein